MTAGGASFVFFRFNVISSFRDNDFSIYRYFGRTSFREKEFLLLSGHLAVHGIDAEVLAASFKNSMQVLELCRYGVGAVTLMPDVFEGLTHNVAIDAAIDDFVTAFEGVTFPGATMEKL